MKNPLKRIHNFFKPNKRRQGLSLEELDLQKLVSHDEIDTMWPDGTWRSLTHPRQHWLWLDLAIRGELLRVWAYEQLEAAEAQTGRRLNPGMIGNSLTRVESGWRPSEKRVKALWASNEHSPTILHYMIGQLENNGYLRP